MDSFKGTPGPWLFTGRNNYVYAESSNVAICDTYPDSHVVPEDSEERHANATLISKSPELLEMLSDLVRCYKRDGYLTNADLEDAEELMNKALGKEDAHV